jgi:hypothetical protein
MIWYSNCKKNNARFLFGRKTSADREYTKDKIDRMCELHE